VDTIKCNDAIEMILRQGNEYLAKKFSSDVIFLKSPMGQPVDDEVKHEIEEIKREADEQSPPSKKLTVFLETTGGYIETVERIVSVFRKHYETVEYVVPNYAYSAGTVLALSGDELYMDYYSVLGPIDPQIGSEDGDGNLPGMGYLAKYEELVNKINGAASSEHARAELAYLIKRFDPGKLFLIEQAVEHSKALLKDWLPKYKFKNWTVHETSQTPVTDKDRQDRANMIAEALGNAKHWHSHGRGVGIKELTGDAIKLKVGNYGDDDDLNTNIANYYGLLTDYMRRNRYTAALHSRRGLRRLA